MHYIFLLVTCVAVNVGYHKKCVQRKSLCNICESPKSVNHDVKRKKNVNDVKDRITMEKI